MDYKEMVLRRERNKEVFDLVKQGLTCRQIAERWGVCYTRALQVIRENELVAKGSREYDRQNQVKEIKMNNTEKELQEKVEALCKEGKWSQTEIAAHCEAEQSRISKIRRGKFRTTSTPSNRRLVEAVRSLYKQVFEPATTTPSIPQRNVQESYLPSQQKAQAQEKAVAVAVDSTPEKLKEISIDLACLPLESQQKVIEAMTVLILGFKAKKAGLR